MRPMSLPAVMNTLTSIEEVRFNANIDSDEALERRSDHALLEATRVGDDAAFAELVGRYRNQIINFVYRMTNDYDGAADLAQETFVRVYKAVDRYKTSHAFSTYIYRIATNLAISELRKRKRRRVISLTGFFQGKEGAEPVAFDPPDGQPLQDDAMVGSERNNAVARSIATLPEKYRAPLVLRDVEGKSYEEISRILETREGTVKSRISRARGLLREKLQAYF
jgi:RNA polymerase sigma-70 factor (ECF subfamily)